MIRKVNEKNSFADAPATGGAGASLVTPGSRVAMFWPMAAGLSPWKISLFVHARALLWNEIFFWEGEPVEHGDCPC